jgi:purine-cytosine permease-like protein
LQWLIINTVAASNIFYDAADGHVPLSASSAIIMVLSLILSFFGYKAIHLYDRYGWMVMIVVFAILAGFGAKHFVNVPMAQGQAAITGVLGFGATVFSWGILWFPLAADYSIYMPANSSKLKTFTCTYVSLWTSCVISFTLGCAFATIAFSDDPSIAGINESRGLGGLVGTVFEGYGTGVRGFGRFIEIILSLSIVGANIPNIYSCGLSTQAIASWLLKVPRVLITIVMFAIALVLSIVAQDHVVEVLSSLMNCLSYWCTPFAMVVLTEHFYFRRKVGYNTEVWNDPKQLPPGLAAITAWVCSIVVSIVSMDQTWYVGPIAEAIGTDIAFELVRLLLSLDITNTANSLQ